MSIFDDPLPHDDDDTDDEVYRYSDDDECNPAHESFEATEYTYRKEAELRVAEWEAATQLAMAIKSFGADLEALGHHSARSVESPQLAAEMQSRIVGMRTAGTAIQILSRALRDMAETRKLWRRMDIEDRYPEAGRDSIAMRASEYADEVIKETIPNWTDPAPESN